MELEKNGLENDDHNTASSLSDGHIDISHLKVNVFEQVKNEHSLVMEKKHDQNKKRVR